MTKLSDFAFQNGSVVAFSKPLRYGFAGRVSRVQVTDAKRGWGKVLDFDAPSEIRLPRNWREIVVPAKESA